MFRSRGSAPAMDIAAPPSIFSVSRRRAILARCLALQQSGQAARYVMDDMVEDVLERLAFLRHNPGKALIIGDYTHEIAANLQHAGCNVTQASLGECRAGVSFDDELPFPFADFDLIVSLGTLDTVNDLPGALVHLRNALSPGGLMIASFTGAGSLKHLRSIMLETDGDRPAARMHPMVDVRAGGQLLQRTGWNSPVIDSRPLSVRFSSLRSLVNDVRAQGLSNALASGAPPLGKAGYRRALAAFDALADAQGRLNETFEILTLSGWRPQGQDPRLT